MTTGERSSSDIVTGVALLLEVFPETHCRADDGDQYNHTNDDTEDDEKKLVLGSLDPASVGILLDVRRPSCADRVVRRVVDVVRRKVAVCIPGAGTNTRIVAVVWERLVGIGC